MKTQPRRYENLFTLIRKHKPKVIIEIGVYDGKHSFQMINEAAKFNKEISYYGFDLFGDITPEIIQEENSKKGKFDVLTVDSIIRKNAYQYANIKLIQGNTKDTLPKFNDIKRADFIFIDGGHSLTTVQFDWLNLRLLCDENTVVVFDDYYPNDETKGCKQLIDHLNFTKWSVDKLQPIDKFPDLEVQMVKVQKLI